MQLKIKDLVALLDINEKTVHEWIKEKKLPAYKINHQYHFNTTEIKEWALNNGISVSPKFVEQTMPETQSPQIMLSKLLEKGGIFYNIEGHSVIETIKNAAKNIPIPTEITMDMVTYSLIQREEMMPTALGKGIAVPHPRNPIITDIENESITLCFLKNKINFNAIDNIPVTTLFIILSANSKRHLEILSKISFLCRQDDFIQILNKQAPQDEIMSAIIESEKNWIKL